MLLRQHEAAQSSNPDADGVISWNEFSENSHIEPSEAHGSRYLHVLAGALNVDTANLDAIDSSGAAANEGSSPRLMLFMVVAFGAAGVLAAGMWLRREHDESALDSNSLPEAPPGKGREDSHAREGGSA
jgi:hypothetical protein